MAFLDLCRLCGTDTLNIVRNAIFEGEGRDKKYAHKIAECLTLQVAVEDKLPKIMCGECSYKLDLLSEFRDKAYKTESQLLSKIDVNKVKAELPDVDDSLDLDNDDAGGDEDDFDASSPEMHPEPEVLIKEEERPAEKRRGRKPAAKRSLRETESEEEEEAPPKKRGRKPKQATAAAATTSPAAAPPKENTGADQGSNAVDKQLFSEKDSERQLKTLRHQHLVATEINECQSADSIRNMLKCDVAECSLVFPCSEDLEKHRQQQQHEKRRSQLRPFDCDSSGCTFASEYFHCLQKHQVEAHSPVFFTCPMCDKPLKGDSGYKAHLAKHGTPGQLKCLHSICQQEVFQSADDLRKHKKDFHDGKVPFRCKKCCEFFSSQQQFSEHKKSHSGNNAQKTTCSYCGKKYKGDDPYRRHLNMHKTAEADVVKCLHADCQQTFADNTVGLRKHVEEHNVLKCDFADCQFATKYKRSMRLHKKKEHSYQCQLRGKQFNESLAFETHLTNHTIKEFVDHRQELSGLNLNERAVHNSNLFDIEDVRIIYESVQVSNRNGDEFAMKQHELLVSKDEIEEVVLD